MNNVPEDRKRKIVNANYINKKSKKIDDDDDESKNLNQSIPNPIIIEEIKVINDTFLKPTNKTCENLLQKKGKRKKNGYCGKEAIQTDHYILNIEGNSFYSCNVCFQNVNRKKKLLEKKRIEEEEKLIELGVKNNIIEMAFENNATHVL